MSRSAIAAWVALVGGAGCTSQEVALSDPGVIDDGQDGPAAVRSSCHDGTDWSAFAGCEAVRQESHFCVGFGWGRLRLLGLDSHAMCSGPSYEGDSQVGPSGTSAAWIDDHVYACPDAPGGPSAIFRVSLVDGSAESVPTTSCTAVTEWGCQLLVMPWMGGHFDLYESFEALGAGEVAASWDIEGVQASRMTTQGARLYTAWHSTDTIDTYALPEATVLEPIRPAGYDTWVHGMAVTEDGLLVLSNKVGGTAPEVHVFDATTGAELDAFTPEVPIGGLTCVVGGEE